MMRDKAIISRWWRGVNEQPVNLLKDILEDTRCVVEGGLWRDQPSFQIYENFWGAQPSFIEHMLGWISF